MEPMIDTNFDTVPKKDGRVIDLTALIHWAEAMAEEGKKKKGGGNDGDGGDGGQMTRRRARNDIID